MVEATEVAVAVMVVVTTAAVATVADMVAAATVDMVVRENDTRKMMGLEGLIRGGQVRIQAGSGCYVLLTLISVH